MVVCFANGIEYEALAKVLNGKGYWKKVIGYQRVDFNRRYALVLKNDRTRDLLVEQGINVDGVHINFAYHRRKEDARIRVFVSQLPIGIKLHQINDVFNAYGVIHNISKIEKVIEASKIDTGDRVVCFTKIARNSPSYVFIKGRQSFIRYRGQIQTCRICGDIDHLARDCPRAKRQNKPCQPSNPDTPIETQETPKPPKPDISQEEIMNTPRESTQGTLWI